MLGLDIIHVSKSVFMPVSLLSATHAYNQIWSLSFLKPGYQGRCKWDSHWNMFSTQTYNIYGILNRSINAFPRNEGLHHHGNHYFLSGAEEYSWRTRSILWLLKLWFRASPGHHRPYYWLRRMNWSMSAVTCCNLLSRNDIQCKQILMLPK